MAKPSQASEVVQPAFLADSRNVVSAKAARPSGAGSAIPLRTGAVAGATAVSSEVLTCILLGRSASIRGEPDRSGGNLHGTQVMSSPKLATTTTWLISRS